MSNPSIQAQNLISRWETFQAPEQVIIEHDGESDDVMLLGISAQALSKTDLPIKIFPTFGNQNIIYGSRNIAGNKNLSPSSLKVIRESERNARMELSQRIFSDLSKARVLPGGLCNGESIPAYEAALKDITSDQSAVVLHTASFKPLKAIFDNAIENQFKNVIFLSYGSVNIAWAMDNPNDPSEYEAFYASVARSSATFVQQVNELTNNNVKYLDICVATSLLTDEKMLSAEKRKELLNSSFGVSLALKAAEIKGLGYDVPGNLKSLLEGANTPILAKGTVQE